jgi:hypothetical protein
LWPFFLLNYERHDQLHAFLLLCGWRILKTIYMLQYIRKHIDCCWWYICNWFEKKREVFHERNKSININSFGGQPRTRPRLQVGLTRDNNKNNYYYSFKNRLESRPKIRSGLRVGRVNQGQYKTKQVIIIVLKLDFENNLRQGSGYRLGGSTPLIQFFLKIIKTTLFWLFFFQKSQQVFFIFVLSRVDLDFWSGQVKSIIPLFFLNLS